MAVLPGMWSRCFSQAASTVPVLPQPPAQWMTTVRSSSRLFVMKVTAWSVCRRDGACQSGIGTCIPVDPSRNDGGRGSIRLLRFRMARGRPPDETARSANQASTDTGSLRGPRAAAMVSVTHRTRAGPESAGLRTGSGTVDTGGPSPSQAGPVRPTRIKRTIEMRRGNLLPMVNPPSPLAGPDR